MKNLLLLQMFMYSFTAESLAYAPYSSIELPATLIVNSRGEFLVECGGHIYHIEIKNHADMCPCDLLDYPNWDPEWPKYELIGDFMLD